MKKLFRFITFPEAIQDRVDVSVLKNRLDWGKPALTLIDVRGRYAFNTTHIMGAVSMPMGGLVTKVKASLELIRDIYVYGETDEETAEAALHLRQAGYQHVAELRGGLAAWQHAQFPVEGISICSD